MAINYPALKTELSAGTAVYDWNWDGTGSVLWGGYVGTSRVEYIRRLRQAPHLSAEELWLFYKSFQIEVEAGVGLSTGQGSEPMLMLQCSKDGGFTWGPERWVTAGKQGEYACRAIWRRFGRARDMVFRVVVSDPVKWTLMCADVDVERGLS